MEKDIMRKSIITTIFKADIKRVWDNNKYDWRSDLSKIDVSLDGNSFTEIYDIVGIEIDHSFLRYKKELTQQLYKSMEGDISRVIKKEL